jgi:cell wall-active antibiotic response 4TMS protein YvqF
MNDDPRYVGATGTATPFEWSNFNPWGLFVVVLGVGWLGNQMGWFAFDWSAVGPLALIFAGLMMVFQRRGR